MFTQDDLKLKLGYNENTGIISWLDTRTGPKSDGDASGFVCKKGYRHIMFMGKNYLAHRLIWFYVHGKFPKNQIDHINGIRDDNRIVNLRSVTQNVNLKNKSMYKNNKIGVVGVRRVNNTNRYRACISTSENINTHIGIYSTLFDAACARKSAEIKYGYHENHGRKPAIKQVV